MDHKPVRSLLTAAPLALLLAGITSAQTSYSPHWGDLTAPDFVKALEQAQHTCMLPIGIIEKHGPSGPLATDLINARYATLEAVKQEYALVFPEYFAGQIFEAKHQPGTIAYSARLQLEMLQETTSEMARNGCTKIVIVSGHGGNTNLLSYFAQMQLDTPKDWVLYVITGEGQGRNASAVPGLSKPGVDGHAGELELSNVMATRPDLVHPERSAQESGADLKRQTLPAGVFTPIFWYASYPNHYQGDAAGATAARGAASMKARADAIAAAIRAIKADATSLRLQTEFFEASKRPTNTRQ
jgi:creatinine amidohydrolase